MVQAFLEACKHGTNPSYRARINIIGHSGAGKTSLTRRLLGQKFHEDEESTDGIETHRIEFDLGNSVLSEWLQAELNPKQLSKLFTLNVLEARDELIHKPEMQKPGATNVEPTQEQEVTSDEPKSHPHSKAQQNQGKHSAAKSDTTAVGQNIIDQIRTGAGQLSQKEQSTDAINGVLRLWDFGGQTEFYTTHHIFLDAEAINIIALDASKTLKQKLQEENEPLEFGLPNTQEEFLCYWLRSIEAKSAEKNITPDVIIVVTHVDMIPHTQREGKIAAFQQEIENVTEEKKLMKIPPEIIYFVDNKDGSADAFAKMRRELGDLMRKQKAWGLPRPITWLKVEGDLKEVTDRLTEKPVKNIGFQDALKVAAEYGMTPEGLDACLMFLNMMGDIVWFRDEKLRDVIILDPQWLVDVFKVLITAEQFIRKRHLQDEEFQLLKQGTVSHSTLCKLWEGNDVGFLTELMQKFDLLLPLRSNDSQDKKFLVPCMLPPTKSARTGEASQGVKPVYTAEHRAGFHDVFPIGTFPKLLAVCAKKWSLIEDTNLSSTKASFEVGKDAKLSLCQPHSCSIQVSVLFHMGKVVIQPLPQVLEIVQVLSCLLQAQKIPQCELCQLICPNWRPGNVAICTRQALQESLSSGAQFDSIQYVDSDCLCPPVAEARPPTANQDQKGSISSGVHCEVQAQGLNQAASGSIGPHVSEQTSDSKVNVHNHSRLRQTLYLPSALFQF